MNKLKLTILAVVASIFASSASAFDPDDLQKLKDTNECVECDLEYANLRSYDPDLRNANLRSANLNSANLSGVILINANLNGANLSRAILSNANLAAANLRGANLEGANLRDAILSYAIMNGAILCNTTMPDGSVIYSGC